MSPTVVLETTNESVCGGTVVSTKMNGLLSHIQKALGYSTSTPTAPSAGTVNSSASAGLPASTTAMLAALMVTLVVVVVAGNALVILAFVVDKSLRNQNNYFFLNLAISDFLVGAFCIPVYMPYILTGRWMLGRGLCKLWLVMDYLLCTASVFNIVLISYDRFLPKVKAKRGTEKSNDAAGSRRERFSL
ncbi:hypothetical protein NFI96_002349 [Prochilodus magdalenae]|nr:hypothetical protein NFI96_002349 [Prochilodus magdalenae]